MEQIIASTSDILKENFSEFMKRLLPILVDDLKTDLEVETVLLPTNELPGELGPDIIPSLDESKQNLVFHKLSYDEDLVFDVGRVYELVHKILTNLGDKSMDYIEDLFPIMVDSMKCPVS